MEVAYSPDIERMDLLVPLSAQLDKLISPRSSPRVKARWSMVREPHAPVQYRLSLRDDSGHVSTDFTLDELGNRLHMQFRLPDIWGDLLKIRNDLEHEEVLRLMREYDPELEVV